MGNATKTTRINRTITVDFQDKATYLHLLSDGHAFVEFVMAFSRTREIRGGMCYHLKA